MSTIALRARSQWRQTNARGYKACMVHPCMEARVLGRHTDGGGQHQAAAGLHLQSSTAPLPAGRPDASQSGDHCPGTRAWLGLTNQRAGEPRLPACRPVRAFKLARTSGDQRTRARVHSTAVVQTCVQCSACTAAQAEARAPLRQDKDDWRLDAAGAPTPTLCRGWRFLRGRAHADDVRCGWPPALPMPARRQ